MPNTYTILSSDAQERISEVVEQQKTSPDFPLFCVTHVTDQSYRFLFNESDHSSPAQRQAQQEREWYVRALRQGGGRDVVSGAAGAIHSESRAEGVASSSSCAPAAPLFYPVFRLGRHSRWRRANEFCVTLEDVERIWQMFKEMAKWSARGQEDRSQDHSRAQSCGPHAPHLFERRVDLQHFIEDVLLAVQKGEGDTLHAIVQFMVCRLPMTECFLLTLTELAKRMLYFSHHRLEAWMSVGEGDACRGLIQPPLRSHHTKEAALESSCAEESEAEELEERPLQRRRRELRRDDVADISCAELPASAVSTPPNSTTSAFTNAIQHMEYAGTVLYLMAQLLERHRERESALWRLEDSRLQRRQRGVSVPATPNPADSALLSSTALRVGDAYYGNAFQNYLLRLSRHFVHTLFSCFGPSEEDKEHTPNPRRHTKKMKETPRKASRLAGLSLVMNSSAVSYLQQMMRLWAAETSWSGIAHMEWELLQQQLQRCQS